MTELSGFEKSAPASRPLTRGGQGPVSAWDMDLSPFHRLVEYQNNSTRQLIDNFSCKIEELIESLREERRQFEKKTFAIHEEIFQHNKSQVKENKEISAGVTETVTHIVKVHNTLQEVFANYSHLLKNIQKNSAQTLESIKNQETLLREGFAPSQILGPLEKLIVLQEEASCNMQNLFRTSQREFLEKFAAWQQKFASIENLLLSLAANLQKQVPDKAFLQETFGEPFSEIKESCKHIEHSFCDHEREHENLEKLYQNVCELLGKQQQLIEQSRNYRHKESILFWCFVVVSLLLFVWLFGFN